VIELPAIKVKLPFRAEDEGVDLMIVIPYAADFEDDLRVLSHVIAVLVSQQPDIRRRAHDDLRAFRLGQHANAERVGEVFALEEVFSLSARPSPSASSRITTRSPCGLVRSIHLR
jgi:hypothetical protein